MRDIEGILFDLDGTLVDSEKLHLVAWNMVLESHGIVLPANWNDDYIGIPDIDNAAKLVDMFPVLADKVRLNDRKQELYRDLVRDSGRGISYPGLEDRLRRLSGCGVKMAVGTNSIEANTRAALEAAGLIEFFPVRITFDKVTHGKPHPEVYLTAALRLGLRPERCAVIEDSVAGVASGKAAGCLTFGVLNTWPAAVLSAADRIFDDTASALDWMLESVDCA